MSTPSGPDDQGAQPWSPPAGQPEQPQPEQHQPEQQPPQQSEQGSDQQEHPSPNREQPPYGETPFAPPSTPSPEQQAPPQYGPTHMAQPPGQPHYGPTQMAQPQSPYAPQPYGQGQYGQTQMAPPSGPTPHGEPPSPYAPQPYGQGQYGQGQYGQTQMAPPSGQFPYGQAPYGQQYPQQLAQQGYGAPAGYPGQQAWSPAPQRKASPLPWLLAGAGVFVLIVVFLVLAFVAPAFLVTKTFDHAAVERGVAQVLTRDYQLAATAVSCPPDQEVEPGTSFACTAQVDGQPAEVRILVRDEDGLYEVTRPQ